MGDFNRHTDVNNGEILDGKVAFLAGVGQERLLGGRRLDALGAFSFPPSVSSLPGLHSFFSLLCTPCLSEAVNALLSPFFLLVTKLTTQTYSCLGG